MLSYIYAITPDITGSLYDLFAHIALFAFFVVLYYEGHRRKYPIAAWLLSLAIIVSVSIIGSRIAIFDMEAWQFWWKEGVFPISTERTSIGVVLFLLPAFWLVRKGLRFKAPILDSLAFAIPLVMLIRRIGCLFAGCCYGTPTESIWGLRYLGPSAIRDQHWAEAIMGADRFGSAAVHPVPVYFIIAAVLCLFLLKAYRSSFRRAGNLTLFSLAILLGFRFFIEFLRDPVTNHQLGEVVFGLKQIQWFLLPSVLMLSLAIWYRERKPNTNVDLSSPSLTRLLFANILLFSFIYWMQASFTLAEKIGIHTTLLLSGIAFLVETLKNEQALKSMKWQTALVAILALVMMGQSYPDNMEQVKNGQFHSFNGNFNRLNLNDATYNCLEVESGCGGQNCVLGDSLNPSGPMYNQFNFGYDFKRFRTKDKKRWRPGKDSTFTNFINYGLSYQPEFFYNKETKNRVFRNNVMPYVGWGDRDFEFTIGLRLGTIWGQNVLNESISREKSSALAGSFRIGSPDRLYLMTSLENSFATGVSVGTFDINITMNLSDFTNNKWEYLRFGAASLHRNSTVLYVEPAFNLGKNFLFTPRFGASYRNRNSFDGREAFAHPSFGVGLHYRLRK